MIHRGGRRPRAMWVASVRVGSPVMLVVLLLAAACASARDPEQSAEEQDAALERPKCYQSATVVVRVDNRSSFDLAIRFGSYSPVRPALGFSRTTYNVPRLRLREPIVLQIIGGGLQLGGPARVATEPVVCDVATLIIESRPRYAFFYGDALRGHSWEEEQGAAPSDSAASGAPSDSGPPSQVPPSDSAPPPEPREAEGEPPY